MPLLNDNEIHVLTSGKEDVIPTKSTRVVICSYGLAPALVESNKIYPGLFKSAIVDESHMLKNIKTKRTSKLVPVLHATNRCVLLSGTPALARPSELWPQLKILSTERDCWWDDEAEFVSKYVQRTSAVRRAELHTMLTGTVMIRRMKHDILKSLPSKKREKGVVDVVTPEMRQEFHKCMELLREGKGIMAKLAKQHSALSAHPVQSSNERSAGALDGETVESLQREYGRRYDDRSRQLWFELQNSHLNDEEREQFMTSLGVQIRNELDVWYRERIHELQNGLQAIQDEEIDRKSVLNRMYSLSAKAKIPLIADMIKRWLADPSKGKLCVFAHHIFVLDDLIEQAGLSNTTGSDKRYIRIDGSTSPRERQAQIKSFQADPGVRIAILGITAAGVAVTLTAASTVWFAELFWTPALMIQAEGTISMCYLCDFCLFPF
jgi:SNF2 family DNA or RNA helicase